MPSYPSTPVSPPLNYIGRFAPSPTGPLHFGSLISALASFLDARNHQGQWLVRMEDLDPPREKPEAADSILRTLEEHGLQWDGSVIYQSQRHQAYEEALSKLLNADLVYRCNCTRQQLQMTGGIYNGRCRQQSPNKNDRIALRLKVNDLPSAHREKNAKTTDVNIHFIDAFQHSQHQNLADEVGDFILRRKDGLFAYQLAVVVDDIHQQITHIIRGSDLLDSTPRQLFLFHLLNAPAPQYGHIPVALSREGQKLSKQNLAPPLDAHAANMNLWHALDFLRQSPPTALQKAPIADILDWAINHWQPTSIPCSMGIVEPST